MHKRPVLLIAALTTAALALVAAAAAATVVFGGFYDVAATRQHWQVTHTLMEKAMRQSVRLRARGIEEPALGGEAMQLRGAACFRDKCVQCHGAPGVAQGDIGKSMQPIPGPLVDAHRHWRARELYWVTRHGIKMSGMPAWEYRLTDAELWEVVAFLVRLPGLNAADYAQWMQRVPAGPSCGRGASTAPLPLPASMDRGKQALHQYACTACHIIPGLTGSGPHVGPSLEGFASRQLIAGTLANNEESRARWIMETQRVKPGTAMPQLDVAPQDAKDMAAYLGTLR